jgi:uncharacterized protein DUF6916
MSIPRRNFLKSATMTTLSAGLALGSAHLIFGQQTTREGTESTRRVGRGEASDFQIPFEAQEDQLFYFRSSTFTPYVGDIFQAPNALGEMIELTLTEVSDYKMKAATRISTKKSRQPASFSLSFTATERLPPFTSIHQLSHPALGKFDLFLTSTKTEDGTFLYEAVFNHIR